MSHPLWLGLILSLTLCLAGCAKSPPTLAGGKPVRHWIETLRSPNARLRKQAVFKLGNVGPSHPDTLPVLLGALNDGDAAVRCEAILALLKFGPAAGQAVANLHDLRQRDPSAQVRLYAAKAAEKLAN